MAKKTAKPKTSGLTVARNGNKFTLTWSVVKDCTDQDIKILVNNKQVEKHDLSKTTNKYSYTINRSNFYPNVLNAKLTEVSFKLAQKQKKKKESSYSDQKEFKITVQGRPGYVQPAQDNTNRDTFTYAWTKNSGDDSTKEGHKMFSYYEYETCLVDEGKKATWSLADSQTINRIDPTTGTLIQNAPSHNTIDTSTVTSVIIRESQSDITDRKKRHFRVRSVGPAGDSSWRESEHQLGGSDPVKIAPTATNFNGSTDTGTSGSVDLNLKRGNPNDSVQVEYAVTAPYVVVDDTTDVVKSSLVLPPGFNSWTVGDTFSGAGDKDVYSFNYPTYVVDDTLLFMRINRIHDGITSYGFPFIMNNKTEKITSTKSYTVTVRDIYDPGLHEKWGAGQPGSRANGWTTRTGTATSTTANTEPIIGSLRSPTLSSIQVNESLKEVTVNCVNNTQLAEGGNHSFIAVYERISGSEKAIGIIPHSASGSAVTFPYDEGADAFGIRCFVANYSPKNRKPAGVTEYTISDPLMHSSGIIWDEDAVSKPPQNVVVKKYDASTVLITWDWSWAQANGAEITWSDNEIIWESIEEPSTYLLTNTRQGKRYITGLSPTKYYFKVRFIKTENETTSYGVYSERKDITLSSAPVIPTLTLSDEDGVVAANDDVTAYWTYQSTDGTPQIYAELAEATRPNASTAWSYTKLPNVDISSATSYTFKPSDFGWTNGQDHYICVSVRSESGKDSEGYSDPVLLRVAPLPVASVSGIGGANDAIRPPVSGDASYELSDYALKKLPITFTVSGAGKSGFCSVIIERSENFSIDRPDDTRTTGFQGETIFSNNFRPAPSGSSDAISVSITADDLKLGSFDNTANYTMYVSITDGYGQTAKAPNSPYNFRVDWDYYSQMPSATIEIKEDEDIAIITPSAPSATASGDICRIYRMSADKPQLILDNGVFGETYVDPYPTYGLYGGYRIVYVSKYKDYKTADNSIAMTEYSTVGNDEDIELYNRFMVSLDFDGNSAEFDGNISLSHSWTKDFKLTRYLGGSMQGDWNPGVQRTGTINGTIPVQHDPDTIYMLHLLADHPGRCHVRTPEGSNFIADVQVKDDREEKWTTKLSKISLSYTKVDSGEEDMMTLTDWRRDHPLPQ